jgi:hypothetical protein
MNQIIPLNIIFRILYFNLLNTYIATLEILTFINHKNAIWNILAPAFYTFSIIKLPLQGMGVFKEKRCKKMDLISYYTLYI